ncbi:MAG TPA: M23 family metallopeptidase [Longimicrobium sp.]|jgi:murein DD-endopeptidase MepM/ murein hydrolase activator NlpD|uniref:M23 family metallopeptidase n=1 Tax=Longimicrobium sp. TaxID=2029185 RepID=UPI002ED81B41
MTTRRMHYALRGTLALAAALSLSACTIAIGAAPERQARTPSRALRDTLHFGAHEGGRAHEGAPAVGASLAIPVRGIGPEQLRDSYNDARSGGRTHNAIDIMAPQGSPVVAATDGVIHRLRTGGLGGITIYQLGEDGRTLFYYAHLARYAAGIREGQRVRRGEVIAYVGDTGNAGPGNYHLHFSVGRLTSMERWWESENVNPYPLLAGSAARGSRASREDR